MDTAGKPRIAFFGLGMMGWPMAACVAKAGYPLTVVDPLPGKAAEFAAEHGATAAADAAEAAGAADIVVLILPTSAQVREVAESIRPALRKGTVIVDMTSGSPGVTRAIAEELAPLGVGVVDAPVSGGAVRARTGELAIMIGGAEADIARVRPVLEAMGTALHVCGAVGAGQTVKALNNLVYSAGLLIATEALLIGQRAGVDPAVVVDVLNTSTGGNGATRNIMKKQILSRSFHPAFKLDLMLKDLTIATDLARETKTTAPYTLMCRETWAAAVALLGPGQDNSAIARFCERLTGDELSSPSLAAEG
jgi:3-hydroxyisobutyrate dehydrogenase